MDGDELLLEAWCEGCELGFDLWGVTTDDGHTFAIEPSRLRCPTCLKPADAVQPKENLS